MIAYEDLDLRIQADGTRFAVFARRGSQTAIEPFELDLSLAWDLWDLADCTPQEVARRGATLFDALIQGRVRDLYQQGRGGSGSDASRGLRIRVLIDPRDERLRPFVRLPWEILFDHSADTNHVLALDARRPIVRMIDSIEQPLDPAPGAIRRVLLALAQPVDTVHLSLKRESADVQMVLGRSGIEPVVVKPATRASLRDAIAEERPQIVHFMGHGTFDPVDREGVLLLENENGRQDPLHASTFAGFFTGKPMPRLVILTSCLTGVPGAERTFEPFASVAAALVAAGLPAVIAMQSEVRDQNALRFTGRLYRGVLRGEPIEAAVSEARVSIHSEDRRSLDWATPVLYFRAQGGGTLETTDPEPPQAAPPPAPSPALSFTNGAIQINGPVETVSQHWNKS